MGKVNRQLSKQCSGLLVLLLPQLLWLHSSRSPRTVASLSLFRHKNGHFSVRLIMACPFFSITGSSLAEMNVFTATISSLRRSHFSSWWFHGSCLPSWVPLFLQETTFLLSCSVSVLSDQLLLSSSISRNISSRCTSM